MIKVAFYTEMPFDGPVSRSHRNMRTEFAWMCALKADHHCLYTPGDQHYDIGILIVPKKPATLFDITPLKAQCTKLAVMQEGPFWGWQDLSMDGQIWYFNILSNVDAIFTHNYKDTFYYRGLTGHLNNAPIVKVLPSLMITDLVKDAAASSRQGVMIGGNFTSWYGGFDSWIVAEELKHSDDTVIAPSMGRKIAGEERLVTHLPYVDWVEWIHQLGKVKYGVHLMRTHAAGTFALNCAYLGIPCIGYEGLDTQEMLHPDLTVSDGDLQNAVELARALKNDQSFYQACCTEAKSRFSIKYSEEVFVNNTVKDLKQILQ